jgi:beta-galactosidase
VNGSNEKGRLQCLRHHRLQLQPEIPDGFHKKYPKRPVYGSETSSAISTRGDYATDPLRNTVNSYDGVVPWGETPKSGGRSTARASGRRAASPGPASTIAASHALRLALHQLAVRHRRYVRLSQGHFYYYKAWWGAEPCCISSPLELRGSGRRGDPGVGLLNLDEVELFVNGKSLGSQKVRIWGTWSGR